MDISGHDPPPHDPFLGKRGDWPEEASRALVGGKKTPAKLAIKPLQGRAIWTDTKSLFLRGPACIPNAAQTDARVMGITGAIRAIVPSDISEICLDTRTRCTM